MLSELLITPIINGVISGIKEMTAQALFERMQQQILRGWVLNMTGELTNKLRSTCVKRGLKEEDYTVLREMMTKHIWEFYDKEIDADKL